ncbi:endo-1,4-beta-xylanase [Sediminicoccus rosea]|jgi:endo-1,4-beta-xylanase|uniref:Beta-xylanase n=1 Tax=Sediminicoccus rosea TaxID=1225128 RepID=A0ABZ0PJB6_9PROT|nr:endo-1,4-beta-xylanase [Sediminicoccus rosea]WPB85819.1 endo-1,4-beta-xylanase [Sediminicoccus rosea]
MPGRRPLLTAALAAALPGCAQAQAPAPGLSLRQIARARGLSFGTAVRGQVLESDQALAALVAREADVIVPEWEGKWDALQPERGRFDFAQLRPILRFAQAHNQRVRGHALLWHVAMPAWLAPAIAEGPAQAAAILEEHITTVLRETRDSIRDWDVLNEIISNPPGSDNPDPTDGDLRPTPWLAALGPSYPERALRIARSVDPTLRLTMNDYGIEADTPAAAIKRARLLRVVRGLLDRRCPLDAIGIQAHLQMREPFRPEPFVAFLQELRGLGLATLITELDVREPDVLAPTLALRDAAVADYAGQFLRAALEGGARSILTWGLTDRDSWLVQEPAVARRDGQLTRGLPYDAELRPKALRERIAQVLAGN